MRGRERLNPALKGEAIGVRCMLKEYDVAPEPKARGRKTGEGE